MISTEFKSDTIVKAELLFHSVTEDAGSEELSEEGNLEVAHNTNQVKSEGEIYCFGGMK